MARHNEDTSPVPVADAIVNYPAPLLPGKDLRFPVSAPKWMSGPIEPTDLGYVPYLKEAKNERASL